MNIPKHLKYTASHEWVADHGDGTATVGITAAAAENLGELVYVELPKPGSTHQKGAQCAVVESTKAAADVYAPLSGKILEVNEALVKTPTLVNSAPYTEGWLFKLELSDSSEAKALLDAATYGGVEH